MLHKVTWNYCSSNHFCASAKSISLYSITNRAIEVSYDQNNDASRVSWYLILLTFNNFQFIVFWNTKYTLWIAGRSTWKSYFVCNNLVLSQWTKNPYSWEYIHGRQIWDIFMYYPILLFKVSSNVWKKSGE